MHKATGEVLRQAVEAMNATPVPAAAATALQPAACCHIFEPNQHPDALRSEDVQQQQQQQQQQQHARAERLSQAEQEAEALLQRVAQTAVQEDVGEEAMALHVEAGHLAAIAAQAVACGEPMGNAVEEAATAQPAI